VKTIRELRLLGKNLPTAVAAELARTGGLLRVAPCCVARSFLQSGKRRKLHPDDLYAFGAPGGGIDERWFASTTEAANGGRVPGEGLSSARVSASHPSARAAGRSLFTAAIIAAGTGRRLLRSHQTLSPRRHALRQTRHRVSWLGPTCCRCRLAHSSILKTYFRAIPWQ